MLRDVLPNTVLITRPQDDGVLLAEKIQQRCRDAQVIVAPVLKIEPVHFELPSMKIDAIVLTSKHGVEAAAARCLDVPIFCVGDGTQRAAVQAGLNAVSAEGTWVELVALIRKSPCKKLLYIRGEHVRVDLCAQLAAAGLETYSVVAYRQIACRFSADVRQEIALQQSIVLPLFSPRSAKIVSQNLDPYTGEITLISLSQAVADAWSGPMASKVICAKVPNSGAMFDLIVSQLD
ncbi:uroporphyrinogen-III synthase [Pacificibacter maritimus]|uniref:Uroporphyrinogen-III synthase n=1 Tax=Pacificibacter maritimus TaxID=762213 RepID=A0A3N4UST4_9RHOB|nr:uroporphyrinogen-III synthase [Pacificibacter maritimus]RPE64750.1 uroporphyrinogen-III synthase [Pacificibacter maritimus]